MTATPPPAPTTVSRALRPDAPEVLGQFALMKRVFARHRLAVVALRALVLLYCVALFAEFLAPNGPNVRRVDYAYAPPSGWGLSLGKGLYAVGMKQKVDPVTLKKYYEAEPDNDAPLGLFVTGDGYKFWSLWTASRRLFGVKSDPTNLTTGKLDSYGHTPRVFLPLGADQFGRCIASRLIHGARTSLSVGLVGVVLTLIFGVAIGGVSGYVGGWTDNVIQRVIEIINSLPALPLWLALGAAMPPDWSSVKTYFAITLVLAFLSWTRLARVVRGKILSLREEDYAVAAKLLGASDLRILFRHLVPGFASHIFVTATLAVPGMILGETSLSFLGLGLKPPAISWGVMLQDCMDVKAVTQYPWLIAPVIAIMIAVLAFNFVGDGLRDAADPYSGR